ncbi:anti-sigma factor family protein [Streptomyces sp. NPDC058548]
MLGALERDEATAFEEHMADCPVCTAEARSLGEVEELLAELAASGMVADDLLDAPMSQRRMRRLRWSLALAASVALFTGGVALPGVLGVGTGTPQATTSTSDHQHPPWAAQLLMTGELRTGRNTSTGVSAKVGMERKKWGTHVALELSGVRGPLSCALVAVSRTGSRKTVTSWLVPAPGYGVPGSRDPLLVHGGAAMKRDEIGHFEVTVSDGGTLVSIPV